MNLLKNLFVMKNSKRCFLISEVDFLRITMEMEDEFGKIQTSKFLPKLAQSSEASYCFEDRSRTLDGMREERAYLQLYGFG